MKEPMDRTATISELQEKVLAFVKERDWQQFHSPKNLAMDIAIEASELMEIFVWTGSKESHAELEARKNKVEEEIGDIAMMLLLFCKYYNIDFATAITNKLKLTGQRYPAEKVRGKRLKYNQY